MISRNNGRLAGLAAAAAVGLSLSAGAALADHDWEGFHWARTSNPFTVKLGDSLTTSTWRTSLYISENDWSQSEVLDTVVVPGQTGSPKTCKPVRGRVEICNAKYGRNGWMGIASVWSSGGHIVQGTVKMNDTYYSMREYNTLEWRNLVMCQEIGHTLGLNHQDEGFTNGNLNTCMDYTNLPQSNQHPNLHDYEELAEIYAHVDSTTTLAAALPGSNGFDQDAGLSPREWGRAIAFNPDGKGRVFVKQMAPGRNVYTFVFWEPGRDRHDHHEH